MISEANLALASSRNGWFGCDVALSGFGNMARAVCANIIISVVTGMLALAFIAPGVVAMLALSQTYFILSDNPKAGVLRALAASCAMMRGNMLKLFCLALSFTGWVAAALLASLLADLAIGLLAPAFAGIPRLLLSAAIDAILFSPALLYLAAARAAFYGLAHTAQPLLDVEGKDGK
jgi:uncharacterized membrane protein